MDAHKVTLWKQAYMRNQVEKFYENLWYIDDSLEQLIKHPNFLANIQSHPDVRNFLLGQGRYINW